LRVRLSNLKSAKAVCYEQREYIYDLETKPAVDSAFIQFRLEFGETEILADRLVLLFFTVLLFRSVKKKIEKDIIIMLPHAFCINRKKDIKSK
jgi:hypothetical protein